MANSKGATKDNVQVGTIITYAYQWASRHPKFARVIKRTPSSVKIEMLDRKVVSHDGYGQNGTCIADLDCIPTPNNHSYRFDAKGYLYIDKCPCYIYEGFEEDFYTD